MQVCVGVYEQSVMRDYRHQHTHTRHISPYTQPSWSPALVLFVLLSGLLELVEKVFLGSPLDNLGLQLAHPLRHALHGALDLLRPKYRQGERRVRNWLRYGVGKQHIKGSRTHLSARSRSCACPRGAFSM